MGGRGGAGWLPQEGAWVTDTFSENYHQQTQRRPRTLELGGWREAGNPKPLMNYELKRLTPALSLSDTGSIVDKQFGSYSKVAKIWHILQGLSWSDQVTVFLRV